MAALGAHADLGVSLHRVADGLAEVLLVLDETLEQRGKQLAGVVDNGILACLTLGHLCHVAFELACHLGRGDVGGVTLKGVDDGHAELAGFDGVVFEVLHLVEALNDGGAGGLGAQTQALHLLHELALAVARRRLGLLGLEVKRGEVDFLSHRNSRQLLVLLGAVRIDGTIAGLHEHVAAGSERLSARVERNLGALDDRLLGQGREEPAGNEVVELPLLGTQLVRVADACGVDGRVVGRLLLAAGGLEGLRGQELVAVVRILGHTLEHGHDLGKVERLGVHGIVDTRVGNEATHVERLSDAHGTRRREALGGGSRLQARGIERRLDGALARLLHHVGHTGLACGLRVLVGARGSRLVLETGRGMSELEFLALLRGGGAAHNPIVLGNEGLALLLAAGDKGKRGGLHATGTAYVAQAAKLGHREVAREHGTPDEVDELARLAGSRQVVVHGYEVLAGKGVLELRLGERRVAGTHHGHVLIDLAHHGHGVRADKLALTVEVGCDDDLVGLLREVLEGADDFLFRRLLHNGCPHKVRKARHLPTLDVHALLGERLADLLEGRVCERRGQAGGKDLAFLVNAKPALVFAPLQLPGKIDRQDMAAQTHGDPLLPLTGEAAHGSVVDLVLLGANTELFGDVLGGVGLLGNYKLHGATRPFCCELLQCARRGNQPRRRCPGPSWRKCGTPRRWG